MNFKKQLKEGLLTNNPVLGQLLGMCSTMAITTTLFNGIGIGLSVTIILICSNVAISLLRKVIPDKIRIAAYIVVIAGFVTMVDLLLKAFVPALSDSLGVRYLPSDFKKRGGYQRSIVLSREYGIYRQNYCGCVFSDYNGGSYEPDSEN